MVEAGPEGPMKVKVLVAQSCPTLCDPMDSSLPGSPVHGILQARILEWGAIPFSRGSSQFRDWNWSPALQAVFLLSEPYTPFISCQLQWSWLQKPKPHSRTWWSIWIHKRCEKPELHVGTVESSLGAKTVLAAAGPHVGQARVQLKKF